MKLQDKFTHFIWGENKISHPGYSFVVKMDFPQVYVKYSEADGMFADYENFFENIADVQWISGKKPPQDEIDTIMIDVWNYIGIEERILDGEDLEDIQRKLDDDDDFII